MCALPRRGVKKANDEPGESAVGPALLLLGVLLGAAWVAMMFPVDNAYKDTKIYAEAPGKSNMRADAAHYHHRCIQAGTRYSTISWLYPGKRAKMVKRVGEARLKLARAYASWGYYIPAAVTAQEYLEMGLKNADKQAAEGVLKLAAAHGFTDKHIKAARGLEFKPLMVKCEMMGKDRHGIDYKVTAECRVRNTNPHPVGPLEYSWYITRYRALGPGRIDSLGPKESKTIKINYETKSDEGFIVTNRDIHLLPHSIKPGA